MVRIFRAGIVAAATILVQMVSACAGAAVVNAPAGPVRGVESEGLLIFKGVPYAVAPVGDLRWKPPVAAPAWSDEFDASEFGPACVQPTRRVVSIYAEDLAATSEDCLSLNIWAPKDARNAPVFFWIHGGSLTSGSSSQAAYNGAELAKSGLVVVSINYRMGILGYLAHPELSAESPDNVSGNYGLLDQIAALEWVQRNIAAFGGDPANVTIAGESAGALSVMYLMAAPPARGLFAKAVAQSAYMLSMPELREARHGMPPSEAVGVWLAGKLGAETIAELRARDADEITNAVVGTGFLPWGTIDGVTLPRQLVDVFDRGEQAPAPILAGFNEGEIRSLRALLPPAPESKVKYKEAIRTGYGDLADRFLEFYPVSDIDESMLATTRDAMYGWTSERLVARQTDLGAPSYLYFWDHGYPSANRDGLHAFHASEIPYVFGTMALTAKAWPKAPDNAAERELSNAMLSYWSSFAKTGVPSAEGQPDWPPYADDESYMHFDKTPKPARHVLPGRYELHEEVVCRRHAAGDVAWNWNVGVIAPPLPPLAPGRQC